MSAGLVLPVSDPRLKTSSVPSGEKPSIRSSAFAGFGITTGLPPLTLTSPIESAAPPHAQPSSRAAVSPFGDRMNCDVLEKSFVGLPPCVGTLVKVKFSMNRIRPPAPQSMGSQQPSVFFPE